MNKPFDLSVYFVADPSLCDGRDVCDVVRGALDGGVSMVQLRDKTGSPDRIKAVAVKLLKITKSYDVPLLINDYIDVAADTGADGVHLGQGDDSPAKARDILGPEAIIGQTAFTLEQITALDPAVNYIGTGPFYETQTKKGKPVLGAEGFAPLAALSPVPVVGIGGITPENAAPVIAAGADGVAMMRAISAALDPKTAAQNFVNAVRAARSGEAA